MRSDKNSGGEGQPRNVGVKVARGEYILFVDSDDMITKTALEELYPIAGKFNADVVCCTKFFSFTEPSRQLFTETLLAADINEQILLTENTNYRVQDLWNFKFLWNVWSKLIRRDFLIRNEIETVEGIVSPDVVFTCCVVIAAKSCVCVPNAVNIYRVRDNSQSHKNEDLQKSIYKWVQAMANGFTYFDNFLEGRRFFQQNPGLKYRALEIWVRECCIRIRKSYAKEPDYELNEYLGKALEKLAPNPKLTAFILNHINFFMLK